MGNDVYAVIIYIYLFLTKAYLQQMKLGMGGQRRYPCSHGRRHPKQSCIDSRLHTKRNPPSRRSLNSARILGIGV